MSGMSQKDKNEILDSIQEKDPMKERHGPYAVGYLLEWVNQLQQDNQILKDRLEENKNQLNKQQQEWWHQQDCDEQWKEEHEG